MCNVCRLFTGMNTQSVLDHCSGCKAKHNKEHMEQEGQEKVKRSYKKKSKSWGGKETS